MTWSLLVMAAGMGIRFGGLKQLAAAGPCGEVLVEYAIFDALRHGCGRVVFVIRPEMEEDFCAVVCRRLPGALEVALAFQRNDVLPGGRPVNVPRTKPWGTAHAVWSARGAVGDGPFAVINADDYYGPEGFAVLAGFWKERHAEGNSGGGRPEFALVGYKLEATLSEHGAVSRGVCRCGEDGRLKGIVEMKRIGRDADGVLANREEGRAIALSGEELVSMNLWGLDGALFQILEEQFEVFATGCQDWASAEWQLPDAIGWAIATGRAEVCMLPGGVRCFGLTHPKDIEGTRHELERLTVQGVYPRPLWG